VIRVRDRSVDGGALRGEYPESAWVGNRRWHRGCNTGPGCTGYSAGVGSGQSAASGQRLRKRSAKRQAWRDHAAHDRVRIGVDRDHGCLDAIASNSRFTGFRLMKLSRNAASQLSQSRSHFHALPLQTFGGPLGPGCR